MGNAVSANMAEKKRWNWVYVNGRMVPRPIAASPPGQRPKRNLFAAPEPVPRAPAKTKTKARR